MSFRAIARGQVSSPMMKVLYLGIPYFNVWSCFNFVQILLLWFLLYKSRVFLGCLLLLVFWTSQLKQKTSTCPASHPERTIYIYIYT